MKHIKQENNIARFTLALLVILGSFSLFSITFGINKNNTVSFPSDNEQQEIKQTASALVSPVQTFSFIDPTQPPLIETTKRRYILQQLQKLGAINAHSFVVGDLDTGEIIFKRKSTETFPVASITKFMTAYTAAEILEPNELATITQEKLKVEGSRGGFKVGDTLTIRELIYPLLLVSSNDAGEIIAQQRERFRFIETMTNLAKEIGMNNTNFEDPTGLGKNNYSTAEDLFILMQKVKNKYPQIIDISRLSFKENDNYFWTNINRAAHYPEFRGGKTGYTNAARQTSIGYYQIKLANDQTKNIAIIMLQSNTRQQDTRNILDYLKRYVAYL